MVQDRPAFQALIVLGARLNPQGLPGRVARQRLMHALQLWQETGAEAFIILTGGRSSMMPVSEAQAMAAFALSWAASHWGPELQEQLVAKLILEEASLSTAASASYTLPLVRDLNLGQVGLVSDWLHIHRACYLFRRRFQRHGVILHPCPVSGVLKHYWQQRHYVRLGKIVLREGGAWVKTLGRRLFAGL